MPITNRLHIVISAAFLCMLSSMYAQEWEAYQPNDYMASVPRAFHPETVKERIISEHPGIKDDLYQRFAADISGLARWNIIKGESYPALDEWQQFLEGQIKRFVYYHGDTLTYHLQIVRDPSINAYATAGGYVFMHVGLLAEARSMEEVVLVLGHELGHNFSQHAWEGYLDRHRASNAIMITSFMGGMAGLIGRTAAISSYMRHSREDESEADKIAIQLLSRAQLDLKKGAGIYKTFMQQQENQRIRFGNASKHWFYGSTHPDPDERYAELIHIEQSVIDPMDHEAFVKMRKEARMERLYLLLADADYRTALESAWRYLIEEPGDQGFERLMYDALRRLKITEDIPPKELVLAHNYDLGKHATDELLKGDQLSLETQEGIKSVLLVDRLVAGEQPFPLNSTFSSLEAALEDRLQQHDNPEAQLLLAIGTDQINEAALKAYIDQGGERSAYARWLMERNAGATNDSIQTILMPSSLSFPGNDLVYGKDYEDFMDDYNWNPILKRFEADGHHIQLIRKDHVTKQTPYSWEMLERFEALSTGKEAKKPFDAARLDPDLGMFMMERNVGGFVTLSVGPANNFIRCDLQVLGFTDPDKPSWQSSDGICIGSAASMSYLSQQVLKRYDKLKP